MTRRRNNSKNKSSGDDEKKKHVPIGNVGYTFRKEFDAGWFAGTVIKIMTDGDRRCKYTDGDIEDLYLNDLIHLAKLDPDNNNNSSSTMEEGFDDTDVITTIPTTLPPMAAVTTTKSMLDVICNAALTIDTVTKAKKQQAKEAGKRKTPSTSLKQGNKKSRVYHLPVLLQWAQRSVMMTSNTMTIISSYSPTGIQTQGEYHPVSRTMSPATMKIYQRSLRSLVCRRGNY